MRGSYSTKTVPFVALNGKSSVDSVGLSTALDAVAREHEPLGRPHQGGGGHCKKVRDDEGYWQEVEVYVSHHSEADFSHGICPDCYKELYPELANNKFKK